MLGQLQYNEFGTTNDRVKTAIQRAKFFNSAALTTGGYYLNYSGGKDSIATKIILELANVRFSTNYNITGLDPPEVVYFIKEQKDVNMHQYEESVFQLIVRKLMPPTRMVRYCCDVLKEHGGEGKFNVTGVRWAESARRKNSRLPVEYNSYGSQSKKSKSIKKEFLMADNEEKRQMIETESMPNGCKTTGKHILNPIVDWSDADVWELIKYYGAEYPSLYDEGFKRIGCIGCPLSKKCNRIMEFKRYPKYKENYIRAFSKMIDHRIEREKPTLWKSGEEVFEWWMKI